MLVARKFASVADFTGLTIDATALYALSAPSVPDMGMCCCDATPKSRTPRDAMTQNSD